MSSSAPRRRRRAAVANWASLPTDLLILVAEKLDSAVSYFRFRAVCSNWRSAPMPALKFSPLLLLPFDPDAKCLPLYDPSDGKIYSLPLPEARHKAFLGSSHGWLALIDESAAISLLHPFSRTQFHLPPVTPELALAASGTIVEKVDGGRWIACQTYTTILVTLYHMRNFFISEITLSCSPGSGGDCLVLAVLPRSSKIAFCRLEEAGWNLLETGLPDTVRSVAYCDGRIYAVDAGGQIAACYLGPPAMAERALSPSLVDRCNDFRILASGKDLLLVVGFKSLGMYPRFKRGYAFYRSSLEGILDWFKVESIEDMTMFLSGEFNLNAFCGEFSGCKKNTVHFSEPVVGITKKRRSNDHCIQVVDLANGRSKVVSCNLVVQYTRDVSWFIPHLL